METEMESETEESEAEDNLGIEPEITDGGSDGPDVTDHEEV